MKLTLKVKQKNSAGKFCDWSYRKNQPVLSAKPSSWGKEGKPSQIVNKLLLNPINQAFAEDKSYNFCGDSFSISSLSKEFLAEKGYEIRLLFNHITSMSKIYINKKPFFDLIPLVKGHRLSQNASCIYIHHFVNNIPSQKTWKRIIVLKLKKERGRALIVQ